MTQSVQAATADLGHNGSETTEALPAPAPKPKPTSWASLLRPAQSQGPSSVASDAGVNVNGALTGRGEALTDALNEMNIATEAPARISFLQPRGLVNTGNMCYMNSVSRTL